MKYALTFGLFIAISCSKADSNVLINKEYFKKEHQEIIRAIDDDDPIKLKKLISSGNLNIKGKNNLSIVFYTLLKSKKKTFSYLLENNANSNEPYEKAPGDFTHMINIATEMTDDFFFKVLLIKSDLNLKDERGLSPLHNAIMIGNKDRLWDLLKHKADINVKDKWGQTPAYMAADLNDFELALALINKGADPLIPDSNGSSIALIIQELKFPPTTKAFKNSQLIREELIKRGVIFPVKRPWDK